MPAAGAPAEAGYQASPARFLTLAIFSGIAFLVAATWLALAPIADIAADRFDVSLGAVNQVALSFTYLYVPGTMLTLYLLDTIGVRACLVTASVVNTVVIAVRWAVLVVPGVSPHAAFGISLLAQFVAACVQPMSLNVVARVRACSPCMLAQHAHAPFPCGRSRATGSRRMRGTSPRRRARWPTWLASWCSACFLRW